MAVEVFGIRELNAKLQEYQRRLDTPREKTSILAAGAAKVRLAASQPPTPKSSKTKKPQATDPHFYYSKRGWHVRIYSGNLRRSMKVFRGKDGDVFIGPKVLRKIVAAEIGRTSRTSSGYYAAALMGSARAFRLAYMEPALQKAASGAFQAIEKRFAQWHNKYRPQ